MRNVLLSLAVLIALARPVGAAEEAWNHYGQIIAKGNLLPTPGVEFLVGFTLSGDMELTDPPDVGPVYRLPSDWGPGSKLDVLVADFDLDGLDDIFMVYDPSLNLDERFGVFDFSPTPTLLWEVCCGFWSDSLEVGRFIETSRSIVVHRGQSFIILLSQTGAEVFNWQTAYPAMRVLGTEILDFDDDGLDEILVQAEEQIGLYRQVFIIESGTSVAVGPSELHMEARPLSARNAPNPFQGPTEIEYTLPARGRVVVRIYDPAGRVVRTLVDEIREAGAHRTSWDGTDDAGRPLRSGMFLYEVQSGGERIAHKMVRIR